MSSVENAEERKESLAVGDPEAGYGSRDPSGVFATGTVPEVEQKIYEAQVEAYEDEKEADGDDGRRPGPRAAEPLQPAADGIEEIGHGHAGDEGQQHAAQQVDDQQESQQRQQPEADLPRAIHHGASIWAIRQPHRTT